MKQFKLTQQMADDVRKMEERKMDALYRKLMMAERAPSWDELMSYDDGMPDVEHDRRHLGADMVGVSLAYAEEQY